MHLVKIPFTQLDMMIFWCIQYTSNISLQPLFESQASGQAVRVLAFDQKIILLRENG